MAASLAAQGLGVHNTTWLKEGVALDIYCSSSPHRGEARRGALVSPSEQASPPLNLPPVGGETGVDLIIQPTPKPRYKLLISDMDSTMITCECIDELADFVGKKKEVAIITERAMNGELDFSEALIGRVALLAGLPESTLQQCFDERVRPMAGAKELLAAHKAGGGYSVLVSGGFTFFTSRVREMLGFDEDYSNMLEIADGKLTGRVIPPILGKEAKLATLHATCKKLGITPEETLAIGDGANDLPMLLAAGLGVAYHAKPSVQAQAKCRINHGDISSLLWVTVIPA